MFSSRLIMEILMASTHLTALQTIKVHQWLASQDQRLASLSLQEATEEAIKALGFPIAKVTIRALAKDLNIKFKLRKGTKNTRPYKKIKDLLVELCVELCGADHPLTQKAKDL